MSVTVQVTVVEPTRKLLGASLVTEATPQLSEVVGVPRDTPPAVHCPGPAGAVTGAGTLIVGFSLSLMVIVWLQELLLASFVAVQVIVVVPTGYGAVRAWPSLRTPDTGSDGVQLSEAVAVPGSRVALHVPAAAPATTLEGQMI